MTELVVNEFVPMTKEAFEKLSPLFKGILIAWDEAEGDYLAIEHMLVEEGDPEVLRDFYLQYHGTADPGEIRAQEEEWEKDLDPELKSLWEIFRLNQDDKNEPNWLVKVLSPF